MFSTVTYAFPEDVISIIPSTMEDCDFSLYFPLLTEIIFSLDGLGLLGFEAAINRDYPIMFATLYFFTLLGLFMNIIGDLAMTFVDPRIDFDKR